VINAVAVLEGLFGKRNTEFVRTPKYGAATGSRREWRSKAGAFKVKSSALPLVELAFGAYTGLCAAFAWMTQTASGTAPFLAIFSAGYLYVGALTYHSRWLTSRAAAAEPVRESKPDAEALAA
jgi:hypothetical protein